MCHTGYHLCEENGGALIKWSNNPDLSPETESYPKQIPRSEKNLLGLGYLKHPLPLSPIYYTVFTAVLSLGFVHFLFENYSIVAFSMHFNILGTVK